MAKKKSRTGLYVGIGIGVLLVIIILSIVGMYNSLVTLDVNVDTAWSQVETSYQRRIDLSTTSLN